MNYVEKEGIYPKAASDLPLGETTNLISVNTEDSCADKPILKCSSHVSTRQNIPSNGCVFLLHDLPT